MKTVDIDKLFDEYISGYVYENIGKVKPEEIENKIPELYVKFGKSPIKELEGFSPEEYYNRFSTEELLDCLYEHIDKKIPVSDFLCEAITKKGETEVLKNALKEDKGEEYLGYLLNFLKDVGDYGDGKDFLRFLENKNESLRELAVGILNAVSDTVKEEIIKYYKNASEILKEYYTEILSHAKKDDRIFNILIEGFKKEHKKTALYCGYLARYGDERALPYLKERVKEKNDYADFEELRFAIESFGETVEEVPDFSSDKTYEKIKGKKRRHIHR